MSIADDPSQWTDKPKDVVGLDVRVRGLTLADYHHLRDALIRVYANSSSASQRRQIKASLRSVPPHRDDEPDLEML